MRGVASSVLLLLGSAFVLIAAAGIVRLPDLFTRMQAATKAGALGAGLILVALALSSTTFGTAAAALLVVAFILATAPVASHAIARAAYRSGVPLWEKTGADELRQVYQARMRADPDAHRAVEREDWRPPEAEG